MAGKTCSLFHEWLTNVCPIFGIAVGSFLRLSLASPAPETSLPEAEHGDIISLRLSREVHVV